VGSVLSFMASKHLGLIEVHASIAVFQ